MRAATGLLAVTLLIGLGCAGGGGGGGSTSGGTSLTGECGPNFRIPNYALDVDPGTGQANQSLHWASFPVAVYRAPHHVFSFLGASYDSDDLVTAALNRWQTALPHGISYQYVGSSPASGVSVTFNRISSAPTAGQALGVTQIFFSPSTGVITQANTTINYWDSMAQDEVAFGLVFTLTHELGHAFFINGHSTRAADVMYYAASTTETRSPTARDANTLANSYCGTFPGTPLVVGKDLGPIREVTVYHRVRWPWPVIGARLE